MARQEFPKAVKVAAVKRATRNGFVHCELCGAMAKKFHFDHVNPDGLTGQPTLDNCMVLCEPCHERKTKVDVTNIAQAKRREARHVGAVKPKGTIKSRPFARKEKLAKIGIPPPRLLYEDIN